VDYTRAPLRSLTAVRDLRTADGVGRRARLEVVFRSIRGRTVLAHAYAEPPLRLSRALPWQDGTHVILASSAPGLFGGDLFEQHIVVERGARVCLTSQSALQVHPSFTEQAGTIRSTFEVEDEAELSCHWDPLIPFAGSRFEQRLSIHLAPSARLLWSDAFMAGRAGRGERWRFVSLDHELRVARGEDLEYLERHLIEPQLDPVDRKWLAGHSCYFGSTVATGWPIEVGRAEGLHDASRRFEGVSVAVDQLAPRLLIARVASVSGPVFHDVRALLRETLGGRRAGP
jgi:urease accessory protein UreH